MSSSIPRIVLVALAALGCFSWTVGLAGTECAASPPAVFEQPLDEELAGIEQPDLRRELLAMAASDQRARSGGSCGNPTVEPPSSGSIDRRNTDRLKQIVAEHGWPNHSLVGRDGARSAWLLAQHADHDVNWQRRCLELMQEQTEAGQVSRADVAYLTDRVLVNEGKPQVYGTQFHAGPSGREPRPIRQLDEVDERRASVGLSTLKEYAAFLDT